MIFDDLKKKRKNGQLVSLVCDYEKNRKKDSSSIYMNLPHDVWASFILPAVGVDYLHYLKSENALKKFATYVKDMASH